MTRKSAWILLLAVCAVVAALPAAAHEGDLASPSPFAATLLMRWVHILSAITMLGGALFVRLVLRSAAAGALDEANRAALITAVRARWKKWVMILTALLLVSGFYNYRMVQRFAHEGQPQYHMLFGIKFLLSLAVFALAAFLVGSTGVGRKLQANEGLWLTVLVILAAATVMVGGYMKVM